ncbi:MAG: rod shape-determining protein MreD [Planctomycetales bacterium]
MKTLFLITAAYLAFVAQAALVPRLPWTGFAPDLLLVVACCTAALSNGRRAIVWPASLGLLGDCLAAGPLGIRMLAATVAAAAIAGWRQRTPRPSGTMLLLAAYPCLFAVLFVETAARGLLEGGRLSGREAVAFAAGRAIGSFAVLAGLCAGWSLLRRALPFAGATRLYEPFGRS